MESAVVEAFGIVDIGPAPVFDGDVFQAVLRKLVVATGRFFQTFLSVISFVAMGRFDFEKALCWQQLRIVRFLFRLFGWLWVLGGFLGRVGLDHGRLVLRVIFVFPIQDVDQGEQRNRAKGDLAHIFDLCRLYGRCWDACQSNACRDKR